jgi:hypothetical protein
MDIHQAKADTNQEMLTHMGANQAEMLARMEAKTDAILKEMKELTARLEAKIEAK